MAVSGTDIVVHAGNAPARIKISGIAKLDSNLNGTEEVVHLLKRHGWRVHIIWECETKDSEALSNNLSNFLTVYTPVKECRQSII